MSELKAVKDSKGYIIGWEAATPIQTIPATTTPIPAKSATKPRITNRGK